MLVLLCGCLGGAPDYVVDMGTTGTADRCVSVRIETVRRIGISSPSVNNVNTRAFARSADGKSVRWDYMRSLREDQQIEEEDEVFLLLDDRGAATGVARVCPEGLGSPR